MRRSAIAAVSGLVWTEVSCEQDVDVAPSHNYSIVVSEVAVELQLVACERQLKISR